MRALIIPAALCALLAGPTVAQEQTAASGPNAEEASRLLQQVILPVGVSTQEAAVREQVQRLLPEWTTATVDDAGNLLVTVGDGPYHIVFLAHLDEIGFAVTGIDGDGRIRVKRHGGYYPELYEGVPVNVHTAAGIVRGVTVPRSGAEGFAKVEDMRIDVGTDTQAATIALGIDVAQVATVVKSYDRLGATRAMGRAMDDRVGTAAQLLALRHLDRSKLEGVKLTFAWVTAEEIGLLGSKKLAQRTRADLAVAIDTFVSSDSPLENKRYGYGVLGKGAVIRGADHSNLSPLWAVRQLRGLAERRGIPLQWGQTGGGNDGSVWTSSGAIDLPIAWPLRSSHSWVEIIDLHDLVALTRLTLAIAEEWRGRTDAVKKEEKK
ncbi:MAG: M20/M25/M40 family metallo-hydrolase [Planctomycetota bacterium]|jgi:putative aminopeptidase FrvX